MTGHDDLPMLGYTAAEVPTGVTELTIRRQSIDRLSVWVPAVRWWPLARAKFVRFGPYSIGITIFFFHLVADVLHVSTTGRSIFWWLCRLIPFNFAVLCVLMFLLALPSFGRRVGLELDPYELKITTTGPLCTRRRRWPRTAFDGVIAGSPGTTVRLRLKSSAIIELFEAVDAVTAKTVADALNTGLRDIAAG